MLGYESRSRYSVSFVIAARSESSDYSVTTCCGVATLELAETLPSGRTFVRFLISLPAAPPRTVTYSVIKAKNSSEDPLHSGQFHVPEHGERPRVAFASCNGYSSGKEARQDLERAVEGKGMWRKLVEDHEDSPIHLMVLGGDQIYTDELLKSNRLPAFTKWLESKLKIRLKQKCTQKLRAEFESFFEETYLRQWSSEYSSKAMSEIPMVMMWDDHDILDGWGSFEKIGGSPVMQTLFEVARKFFCLFQLKGREQNASMLDPTGHHLSWSVQLGNYVILAMDNRSRRTTDQIMDEDQWSSIKAWLKTELPKAVRNGADSLAVVSPVPVVYPEFGAAWALHKYSEWSRREDDPESMEDDLRDHWRHPSHQGERARLIMNLLEAVRDNQGTSLPPGLRTALLLSGDVHVASAGLIKSHDGILIHQIVSSGIVHPPPSRTQLFFVRKTSDDSREIHESGEFETSLVRPVGARDFLYRSRNYVVLDERKNKLYASWKCEGRKVPLTLVVSASPPRT